MVPVLSIQPSMFSPAVTSAADRPITASAERRAANWPIRARGRKSLLCARCELISVDCRGSADARLLINRCGFDELLYSFTENYALKKYKIKRSL